MLLMRWRTRAMGGAYSGNSSIRRTFGRNWIPTRNWLRWMPVLKLSNWKSWKFANSWIMWLAIEICLCSWNSIFWIIGFNPISWKQSVSEPTSCFHFRIWTMWLSVNYTGKSYILERKSIWSASEKVFTPPRHRYLFRISSITPATG